MSYSKTDLMPRCAAALIDGVIAWIPSLIPFIGFLLGGIYILCKDSIMYQITKDENWQNKSIGKKVLNLEVANLDGGNIDLKLSAKRNIPLAIGTLIAVIPIIGWAIGAIIGFILGVIELILVLTDDNGRRLGDKFANTQVIEVAAVEKIDNENFDL
ncbi:MAG: RDD family protein [Halothermotrichaceae bacterium]